MCFTMKNKNNNIKGVHCSSSINYRTLDCVRNPYSTLLFINFATMLKGVNGIELFASVSWVFECVQCDQSVYKGQRNIKTWLVEMTTELRCQSEL